VKSRWLVSLLLALGGCTREALPPDVLATTTVPVRLALRRVAMPLHDCTAGSIFERARCKFSANEEVGCVYLEFSPAGGLLPLERCSRVGGHDELFPIVDTPLESGRLVAEPGGERVLIELGASGFTVMSWRGQPLGIVQEWPDKGPRAKFFKASGEPEWLVLRSVLEELDRTEFELTPAEIDSLVSRTSAPMEKLLASLDRSLPRYRPDAGFDVAASRLDEEHQQRLRGSLEQELAKATPGARRWFVAHPEAQDAAWVATLVDAQKSGRLEEEEVLADFQGADAAMIRRAMVHAAAAGNRFAAEWVRRQEADQADYLEALLSSLAEVPSLATFAELRRLAPAAAATTSCAVLEQTVRQEELVPRHTLRVQLALIVAQKTRCAATRRLLERLRCEEALTCGNESAACSATQQQAALQRMIDGTSEAGDWAPLLSSAAGPLPPAPRSGCPR
jgi:hypothetical protein